MGVPMRLRTISLAAAGLLTAVGSLALVLPSASAAASGCKVDYKIASQWPGGFQGDVAVTNLGDAATSWTLAFDFGSAAQKVTQGWSAVWTQQGVHVAAANAGWNGTLGTGATVS